MGRTFAITDKRCLRILSRSIARYSIKYYYYTFMIIFKPWVSFIVLSLEDNKNSIFLKDGGFFTILLNSQYPMHMVSRGYVTYIITIILSRLAR